MEEAPRETCRVVYFCPDAGLAASRVFHPSNPPAHDPRHLVASQQSSPLRHVYDHVHMLLDEDMGGFEEVFVSSNFDQCLDQVTSAAHEAPTAVLLESRGLIDEAAHDDALLFLEAWSTRVRTTLSPFPQKVMMFVIVISSVSPATMYQDPTALLDPALTEQYRTAGALDIISAPMDFAGLNRLIGRVKESNRPPAQRLGATMTRGLWQSIADHSRPCLATYRPDERIVPERKTTIERAIRKWQFPAHEFDMDELTYGALFMLEHVLRNPQLESYRLSRAEMITFLLATRRQYKHEREVHYHNWRHAVDVTQSLYCFLCDLRLCPLLEDDERRTVDHRMLEQFLTPVDALTLLVAAIGHDVGHPGVNNAFLVACSHSLAHLYNDRSVLENYHCATYTQIVRRHWPSLGTMPRFRDNMISTILATDMQRHFEYMSQLGDLNRKVGQCGGRFQEWSDKEKDQSRDLLMSLLIKAADISNVARPFDIAAHWAQILMNEFARQGELEAELRMPTCLFGGPPDREDQLAAAQSQKGFMNLFGFPLFRGIADVMPSISCTMLGLEHNRSIWEKKIDEERSRREATGDGTHSPRVYSLSKDNVELARRQKRDSEPGTAPTDLTNPLAKGVASRRLDLAPTTAEAQHESMPFRHPSILAATAVDHRRTSAPMLGPSIAIIGDASRRSSKDVALNQLHELNLMAQNALHTGSRRSSVDTSWQIHASGPGSRRASKDDGLTTVLVASQGPPSSRSDSTSPSPALRPHGKRGSMHLGGSTKRHSSYETSPPPMISSGLAHVSNSSHSPSRTHHVANPSSDRPLSSSRDSPLANASTVAPADHIALQDNRYPAPSPRLLDINEKPLAPLPSETQNTTPSPHRTPWPEAGTRVPASAGSGLGINQSPIHLPPTNICNTAASPIVPAVPHDSSPPSTPLAHIETYSTRPPSSSHRQRRPSDAGIDRLPTSSGPSLILSPTKSNTTTAPSDIDPRYSSSSSPRLLATQQTTPATEEDSDDLRLVTSRSPRQLDNAFSASSAGRSSTRALEPPGPARDRSALATSGSMLRQQRSRSRLRGLKFWLKRREAGGSAPPPDAEGISSSSKHAAGEQSP